MAAQTDDSDNSDSTTMLRKYLDRIGIENDIADAMIEEGQRQPSASDLGLLLRSHLTSVPFENLSQHIHASTEEFEEVPITRLPSLNIEETLQKIVLERRGGFCFEINTAFAWLLRQLGYSVRFGSCNVVTPDGPVPGHLCMYVEGLGEQPLMVDPGFGDAPRVPIPAKFGNTVSDAMLGDEYTFAPNSDPDRLKESPEQSTRFSAVLMRSRKRGMRNSPMGDIIGFEPPPVPPEPIPEPIYLLNFDDDLEIDCREFQDGLAGVLAVDEKNVFSQKRICIILRDKGFDYVGTNYWKEVRGGLEVSLHTLDDEGSYRETLQKVAGIKL